MAHIHHVGEPENASETKAIRELGKILPDDYFLIHNFELATGQSLPYEYDICVVGEFAVYHVEVKGYRGMIRGDRHRWTFENGGVYPSPIPLANKKTKILAGKLRGQSRFTQGAFVETVILLTDHQARINIRDEQAHRVVTLRDAVRRLTDPSALPIRAQPITQLQDPICQVLLGQSPSKKVRQIGLYNILEKINQTELNTVYLAEHQFIKLRPKTVLKVFHYDLYAKKETRDRQIQAIFHNQEALRLLSGHPNIIQTGDFFPWEGNKFVLPTEYIEQGRPLEVLLDKEEDKALSWAEKRDIITAAAHGLQHAHKGGVIHRNIRPLNLVVSPSETKLVNFDLAKIIDASEDVVPPDVKERIDPDYCAPEVLEDPRKAEVRSDVYSLGMVFYELITGEKARPFNVDLLLKELSTPGSEDFMKTPVDAASVIEKMCRPEYDHRYASMNEVLEDLQLL